MAVPVFRSKKRVTFFFPQILAFFLPHSFPCLATLVILNRVFPNHIWLFHFLWWCVILRSAVPIILMWSFIIISQSVPNLKCVCHIMYATLLLRTVTVIYFSAHSGFISLVCLLQLWLCPTYFCPCLVLSDGDPFFIWLFLFKISLCQFVNECANVFSDQSVLHASGTITYFVEIIHFLRQSRSFIFI